MFGSAGRAVRAEQGVGRVEPCVPFEAGVTVPSALEHAGAMLHIRSAGQDQSVSNQRGGETRDRVIMEVGAMGGGQQAAIRALKGNDWRDLAGETLIGRCVAALLAHGDIRACEVAFSSAAREQCEGKKQRERESHGSDLIWVVEKLGTG